MGWIVEALLDAEHVQGTLFCRFCNCKLMVQSKQGSRRFAQLGCTMLLLMFLNYLCGSCITKHVHYADVQLLSLLQYLQLYNCTAYRTGTVPTTVQLVHGQNRFKHSLLVPLVQCNRILDSFSGTGRFEYPIPSMQRTHCMFLPKIQAGLIHICPGVS